MRALALILLVACGPSRQEVDLPLTVAPLDDVGGFQAYVSNPGTVEATDVTCTVRALDRFGNRVGFDYFDVGPVPPGGELPFNGSVGVDETPASFEGHCEWYPPV